MGRHARLNHKEIVMGLYFGGKLVSPVVTKEVAKTKFGVSVDTFLGDVDENGKLKLPKGETVLDLTGVKTVESGTFMYKFYRSYGYTVTAITKIIADDLESVGIYAFYNAFFGQRSITEARFGIKVVTSNYAFRSCFSSAEPKVYFYNLKRVDGVSAFANIFESSNSGFVEDKTFPVLEEVSGNSVFDTYKTYSASAPSVFSSIKKITGNATAKYSSTFGSIYKADTVWKFPRATELTGYVWNVGTSYTGEIHFAAANQAVIEACDKYDEKWGFVSATIYFDLMLNITVNGVVYSRKHTIDGYTSWEDASGNLVYTDATAEPAVDTVVYSDQGTTQVGTVSEAS